MLYRLYIGSNNQTHQVEEEKLKAVVSKYFQGFTVIHSEGYWMGTKEESRIVEIQTDNKEQVLKAVQELKAVLAQEAIGFVEIPQEMAFL